MCKGVAPKLYCSGQRVLPKLVSLCSTRSQSQDCRSLLNLLLLDATGFPAAFPLTRQSMLILLSGFPEAIGIPGLLDAIGLDAVEEHVAIKEEIFITAGRDLDKTLSSSFCSCILFATVEQLIKLKFLVQHVELKWLILNK